MARFSEELPNDLIKEFENLNNDCDKIFGEMVKAGAEVTYNLVRSNMSKVFKTTNSLEKGLKITNVYKTPSDDGINVKVAFYGYDGIPTKKYPNGTPIPLKALAREYGTSRGETKKPFFRKSFNKNQIERAMLKVQDKYIKGD